MKNLAIVACSLLLLTGCKDDKKETTTATTIEKAVDTTTANTDTAETPKETEGTTVHQLQTINEQATTQEIVVSAPKNKEVKVDYASFGDKIAADRALTAADMMKKYAAMKKGDTIAVKFKSTIKDVCKKKGCWMSMELPNKKESFVRFKDYGFFVPLNADNSEAIVSGRAYLDVISVDELKHYAKDGGKSQEEIDKINTPKITYAFQADGVLIEQ